MKAMQLERPGEPLRAAEMPTPEPGSGQILERVAACGVCPTNLHVVDGDLTEAKLPIVPGHEIVGYVEALGFGVERFARGQRVEIAHLRGTDTDRQHPARILGRCPEFMWGMLKIAVCYNLFARDGDGSACI